MRPLFRLPLRLASLLALLLMVGSAGADETVARLRTIAQEADKLLELINRQSRELYYRATVNESAAATGGNSRTMMGGQFTVADLQRSTRRLADLGSEASSRMSRCGEDVRRVGRDFSQQTRQINSMAGRLMSSRENASTTMTLGNIDFAVQRLYGTLPAISGITECVTSQEGEGTAAEEEENKDKKKDDKGTEEYNE